MATHNGIRGSSSTLPSFNSSDATKIKSVLPFFGFINMTISCGITVYRSCLKGDIPMIVFVTFVYFATYMLDYLYNLCKKLPPSGKSAMLPLKIGYWVLNSAIMLGFAFAFSTSMSLAASISVFGMVICAITLLFYVYFVRYGDGKNCAVGSSNEGKRRKAREHYCICRNRKATLKKYRHIALALENV